MVVLEHVLKCGQVYSGVKLPRMSMLTEFCVELSELPVAHGPVLVDDAPHFTEALKFGWVPSELDDFLLLVYKSMHSCLARSLLLHPVPLFQHFLS